MLLYGLLSPDASVLPAAVTHDELSPPSQTPKAAAAVAHKLFTEHTEQSVTGDGERGDGFIYKNELVIKRGMFRRKVLMV